MLKDTFIRKCAEQGIDLQYFILGNGAIPTGSKNAKRYKLCHSGKTQKHHLFAIQFCKDRELCIAWPLKVPNSPRISNYSVKASDAINKSPNDLNVIDKREAGAIRQNTEFYTFTEPGITQFLIKYVSKCISNNK